MKFKKSIYMIVALLGMNIICGCSDWLDYTPKDKQVENQQFSSRDGFYAAVNGVYNKILSNNLYGKNLTYGALDCMAKRYNTGAQAARVETLWAQHKYTETAISNSISSIWSEAYAAILNINVILDNVDKQNGVLNEKDCNVIKGDLLALRAFLHLDMLRLFGPVYSRNPESKAIPYNDSSEGKAYELLSAKAVIYDHLIPDLTEAERILKQSDPVLKEGVLASDNDKGDNYLRYRQLRLNYYATVLLKARAYLWAGDKVNAAIEARKITDDPQVKAQFPFVDSDKLLGNTTNPDRVFSTEILFGFYNSSRSNIYTNLFDGTNLSSSVLLQPRNGYIELLFPTIVEYRYSSQWSLYGGVYNFIKYKEIIVDLDNPPLYTYLMPLIHLSEAYYIASEALANTDIVSSVRYLNTILKARGASVLEENSSPMAVVTEIQKEYMREMCGEGQVFYMLKRFYQNMSDVYNGESGSTVSATEARYVLPLPESELINR